MSKSHSLMKLYNQSYGFEVRSVLSERIRENARITTVPHFFISSRQEVSKGFHYKVLIWCQM